MQADVARAQAGTLRDWAEAWTQQAVVGRGDNEVALLLHRAARAMDRTIEPDAHAADPADLPQPREVVELRDG